MNKDRRLLVGGILMLERQIEIFEYRHNIHIYNILALLNLILMDLTTNVFGRITYMTIAGIFLMLSVGTYFDMKRRENDNGKN